MNDLSQSRYIEFQIENGILIGTYTRNLKIDLEVAKHISEQRLAFSKGCVYPSLLFTHYLRSVNKEARDYFAVEGVKGMSALAIVPGNFIDVIATNLFITFSRPTVPTRAFKNRTLAVEWLNQFKN
jgi:hypothetical protein